MAVLDAVVVVSFEPEPGVQFAAVWDGGKWCRIHAVDGGTFGPCVEAWDMHDGWHGVPQIECTPAALQRLVEWRLDDPTAAAEMLATAEALTTPVVAPRFARNGYPQFSQN